ncbi:MAG: hypothetical protein IKP06_05735 [Elusimicrobiaceae bacterium]|nr:hypothetical protein [Elusimicrobiaceae bacterium]
MERLLEMVGVLAMLYVAYALTLGKWNYDSPTTREKRKEELKHAGLSSQFYFMNAGTLLVLALASAGTFTFYWLYKQWQCVHTGFKRAGRMTLHGNAFWRAVAGIWSFFALGELINRTCEYTHKETSWPAFLWGTVWIVGLALILSPAEYIWKIIGYVLFCVTPVVFQRRINTLTREYLPLFPRAIELAATLIGAICAAAIFMLFKFYNR